MASVNERLSCYAGAVRRFTPPENRPLPNSNQATKRVKTVYPLRSMWAAPSWRPRLLQAVAGVCLSIASVLFDCKSITRNECRCP